MLGEKVGLVGARVLGVAEGLLVEGREVGLRVGGAVALTLGGTEEEASRSASRAIAERRPIGYQLSDQNLLSVTVPAAECRVGITLTQVVLLKYSSINCP